MNTAVKYGLFLGGFLSAYGLVFRLLNLPFDSPFGWIFYISLPIFAGLALWQLRKTPPLSYWRALGTAAMITVLGGAIYSLYVFAFNAFIDDSLIQAVRDSSLANMASRNLSPEGEEARRALIVWATEPLGFAITIAIQMTIASIVSSFVLAIFFRRTANPAA